MFKPTPLNRTYRLGGFQFNIYSVEGFDFKEELDLPHTNGVYCFSTPDVRQEIKLEKGKHTFRMRHTLKYLGKTQDFAQRFDRHHKGPQLLNERPLNIGIYYCSDGENEETIEAQLLSQYIFPLNQVENEEPRETGNPDWVIED